MAHLLPISTSSLDPHSAVSNDSSKNHGQQNVRRRRPAVYSSHSHGRTMGTLHVVMVAAHLLLAAAVQQPRSVIVEPTGLWSGTNNYYGTSWTPGPPEHKLLDWPEQTSSPPANVCPETGGCRGCGAVAPVALSDRVIGLWPSSLQSSFAVYAISYDTGKVGVHALHKTQHFFYRCVVLHERSNRAACSMLYHIVID